MPGVERVVGVLIAWAVRKAGPVGERVDGQVDQVLNAGVDRLGELVSGKLEGDPALAKLEAEAGAGEVSERTWARLASAVEYAAEADPGFAYEVLEALSRMEAAAGGPGVGGVTVLGGVSAEGQAEGATVAGWSFTGPVTAGITPPPGAGAGGSDEKGRGDPPVPGRP